MRRTDRWTGLKHNAPPPDYRHGGHKKRKIGAKPLRFSRRYFVLKPKILLHSEHVESDKNQYTLTTCKSSDSDKRTCYVSKSYGAYTLLSMESTKNPKRKNITEVQNKPLANSQTTMTKHLQSFKWMTG